MIARLRSYLFWHRFQRSYAKAIKAAQERHATTRALIAARQATLHAALAGGKR